MNKLKPFTIEDLVVPMKDRDYLRAELTDIHNQIRASQSKMDYLLKKEEEVMSRIVSLDKKIAEIASQLKGG